MAKTKYVARQFRDDGVGKMKWGVYIQMPGGEEVGIQGKITDAALVASAEDVRLAIRIAAMLNG